MSASVDGVLTRRITGSRAHLVFVQGGSGSPRRADTGVTVGSEFRIDLRPNGCATIGSYMNAGRLDTRTANFGSGGLLTRRGS